VKVSAVIIAFNEENNIARAIDSVSWADEVLVIDSHSSDRTREIARNLGAGVIERDWPGFSAQKQFGVDSARNEWILSLDADEWLSDPLKTEIQDITDPPQNVAGYRIPRLTVYMKREIRHGGWYPDLQLRLFDRRRGRWNGRIIHESIEIGSGARVERLVGNIMHKSVDTASEHAAMIKNRYAPLSARQMFDEGRQTSRTKTVLAAASKFIETYLIRGGILDGLPGFYIAYFAARNTRMKHALLRELHKIRKTAAPK